ncbi:hypothetical protein CKO09_02215 [Chromatium weissei]|nr:hypothetical protein [Chromatium weissei]
MKLDSKQTAFGRHETFPLRYAWLTKGFDAITQQPNIFSHPDRAMVVLGVGRNMTSAIQYWLQATRLVEFTDGLGMPTLLGDLLLGNTGDPYLEDESTLWILHWLIASNTELATGFFWFFNRFAMPRFQELEMRTGMSDFVAQELQIKRSQSTVKSDVSTLLRMYTSTADRSEDHLDTPMAPLRLIETEGNTRDYRSLRTVRPLLPPVALHFALAERFTDEPEQPALPIRLILYGGDDRAAPGAVFRLSEEGLMTSLAHVMEHYPRCYELRDTAGIHQLYRGECFAEPLDIIDNYYKKVVA